MAIKHNYSEAIKCMGCGSNDVSTVHSSSGLMYCTCNLCGKKFVVQTEGVDLLDQYLSARAKVFRELEMTQLNNKSSAEQEKVRQELENLIQSFALLAEIDTIYYWYKIVLITKNFTDYTHFDDAQREFAKLPADKCYLVATEDIVRNERYKKQYGDYVAQYEEDMYQYSVAMENKKVKKKKTAKALAISIACVLVAIIIGLSIFTAVYNPTLTNEEYGVVVDGGSAFGLIGKFNTQLVVDVLTEDDDAFVTVEKTLQDETNKFKPYSLQLLQKGDKFAPKGEFSVTLPIPKDYNIEKIGVYAVGDDGKCDELHCVISSDKSKITFKTDKTGIFVVAEKPFVISFDSAGGSEVGSQKVTGGELMANATSQRVGYTFVGWYDGDSAFDLNTPITKDLSLTARWSANEYNINYYIDGKLEKTQKVTYDDEIQLYVPERKGYSAEWYRDSVKFSDGKWTLTSDVKLEVKWTAISVKLTFFNYSAGSGASLVYDKVERNVLYDDAMPNVSAPTRKGYIFKGYYFQNDATKKLVYNTKGECSLICDLVKDTTLRAQWERDPYYASYELIETPNDLEKVRENTNGNFLLLYDLDLQGVNWNPLPTFSGTFDGGNHCIYNFNLSTGAAIGEDKTMIQLGLFSYITNGTVKNLQIGKERQAVTTVKFNQNNLRGLVGMIAGEIGAGAVIDNCRSVNCSIDVYTYTDSNRFNKWDWSQMVGGICGYATLDSTITRCYVADCDISNKVETKSNSIRAYAQTGGICGQMYGKTSLIQDCLTKRVTVNSYAIKGSGAGTPQGETGGIAGRMHKDATIVRCISVSDNIKSTNTGGGTAYYGSIIGWTQSTHPSNLFRINISLQYSGSNKSYGAGNELATDSYADLIATDPTFNNGYWISDYGTIMLDFYKNN